MMAIVGYLNVVYLLCFIFASCFDPVTFYSSFQERVRCAIMIVFLFLCCAEERPPFPNVVTDIKKST